MKFYYKLPPHRDYDCEINTLPESQPPYSKHYTLIVEVDKVLQEYIAKKYAKGFIRKGVKV